MKTIRRKIRRLREAMLRLVTGASWPGIVIALALLYLGGAVAMPYFEGPDSPLGSLADYTWWFIVTATTVGYGDISPASPGGRVCAVVIMLLGVGLIAITVGKIAEEMVEFGKRRMRGLTQLNEHGHLVILGYCKDETENIVEELLHDQSEEGRAIVLCSDELEENPMPDRVKYVRGDLSSDDVLQRACVADAARVLVHCKDDNDTLVAVLAAHSVNQTAHYVARVTKEASEVHLRRIDPTIECVRSLSTQLMVHAIQDRGTTAVISSLLSHASDDTVFRMELPQNGRNWTFGALQKAFKEKMDVTVIAMAGSDGMANLDINPASSTPVAAGASLFYVAMGRIDQDRISWNEL